jgi:hypothetical protein
LMELSNFHQSCALHCILPRKWMNLGHLHRHDRSWIKTCYSWSSSKWQCIVYTRSIRYYAALCLMRSFI